MYPKGQQPGFTGGSTIFSAHFSRAPPSLNCPLPPAYTLLSLFWCLAPPSSTGRPLGQAATRPAPAPPTPDNSPATTPPPTPPPPFSSATPNSPSSPRTASAPSPTATSISATKRPPSPPASSSTASQYY